MCAYGKMYTYIKKNMLKSNVLNTNIKYVLSGIAQRFHSNVLYMYS